MPSDIAVRAEGVGKRYLLGQLQASYTLLTEAITERARGIGKPRAKREDFWALRDIDFEVRQGERFGIIGHNGAGKSTLLKLLARVTPPTEGRIHLRGRVGALLEVGTGFNGELTGRENIFLNGAILGMSRQEIARKFDEIVQFAEVERFVDTPVKRYSSGMYLRLAFAVAAHLEPEVLIVDEVLSVGDIAFQRKCLGRMEEVAGAGRTVLFVSHNLPAVAKLCPRSMLLAHGRKIGEGPTEEIVRQYVRSVQHDTATPLAERKDRQGSGRLRFTEVRFESPDGIHDAPVTGKDLDVVLTYEGRADASLRRAHFGLSVYTVLGTHILQCQSNVAGVEFGELPRTGEVRLRLPRLPLPPGRYTVNVYAELAGEPADWVQRAAELTVTAGDFYGTGRVLSDAHQTVLVDQQWSLTDISPVPTAETVSR